MRKNCFGNIRYVWIIAVVLFSAFTAGAQGVYNTTSWRFSNPKAFGFTVLDVDFFDNNNVIAVGSDGGIAKSTDGGRKWTYGVFTYPLPTGVTTKPTFNDVHYITANIAYAVGQPGCVAKTTDGGATWSFINNPLYANQKNINTCWFLNKDTGYIAGQFNTPDSLPKLYYTRNGGSTWDSISAPAVNGVTRAGYINNVNIPSVLLPVDAKAKDIYRIEFINDSVGYVCGSGSPLFPRVSSNAVAATCLPSTGNLTTGAHTAALLWKIKNNVLTDYSISKERIGYTGINTNTVTCTTGYSNLTPAAQTYRALNILNDSTIVMMSFNNNCVIRVNTGRNDSTANVNNSNIKEIGKYTVLNFPFPPTGGPNAGPPIPNPQVLLASNPYYMRRAANGKLYAAGNFGLVWTSTDNGVNWNKEYDLPQGQNFSGNGTWGFDIAPNGRFLAMGSLGVVADSITGSTWQSVYTTTPLSGSYNKIEFADCNNGIATGGASLTVTTDGGKTWIDRARSDFAALGYSINGMCFPSLGTSYYAVSTGFIYRSVDQGVTMDPLYTNTNFQMQDVASIGNNIWACGYSSFSVPAASKQSGVFRSTNGGTTWTALTSPFATGSTFQSFTDIEFPTATVGYLAGNKDTVWKTTDGGATWSKLPLPFPGVTPQITYTDMFALDANTVFLCGNGFPRKVVIKTTDGGATWQDITSNILAVYPTGNLNGILFHDAQNGFVCGPGGALLVTTNGGASWTLDLAPTATLTQTMAFAPKTVPAGTPFANHRMFMCGGNVTGAPIMEYGNNATLNVSSAETLKSSCDNASTGSITIAAAGGIAPYTYSLDGGTAQTSNVFNGVSAGLHNITIRDAACGIFTKSVNVPVVFHPTVDAGADVTILDGDKVTLSGVSSQGTASVSWTPAATLTGANTLNPVANPHTTTTYTMTATDLNGCSNSDNMTVTVIPICIKVMDAFTPNGDGQNDRWLITGGAPCTKKNAVAIYNRYGSLVYKNDDYKNDWDGTYNGKPVPDGVYYYHITFNLINGQQLKMEGDVTILR